MEVEAKQSRQKLSLCRTGNGLAYLCFREWTATTYAASSLQFRPSELRVGGRERVRNSWDSLCPAEISKIANRFHGSPEYGPNWLECLPNRRDQRRDGGAEKEFVFCFLSSAKFARNTMATPAAAALFAAALPRTPESSEASTSTNHPNSRGNQRGRGSRGSSMGRQRGGRGSRGDDDMGVSGEGKEGFRRKGKEGRKSNGPMGERVSRHSVLLPLATVSTAFAAVSRFLRVATSIQRQVNSDAPLASHNALRCAERCRTMY